MVPNTAQAHDLEARARYRNPRFLAGVIAAAGVASQQLLNALRATGPTKRWPYLTGIGIPLAIIAAFFSAPLLLIPLIVCAWAQARPDSRWHCLVVIGRGVIGVEWALVGVNLLGAFPQYRIACAILWLQLACLLYIFAQLFAYLATRGERAAERWTEN